MKAIRTIQKVTEGEVRLQLPKQFWGKEVEIIVLANDSPKPPVTKGRKSLHGALKQYAKPERMADESAAWPDAVKDNHEPS
ncbi:MAG: hypothetical protein ACFCBW_03565 [Candidatus Competibacterales bacterium]